ncbi:MAG: methylated-DNA--[protein]-cysteine S-methyltransferase [Deltaproteobacteria bacterium]|nr:methylated-DNA--[protein]-cysteine S-methyltransferase [Deltaproteobacteria bacterium]
MFDIRRIAGSGERIFFRYQDSPVGQLTLIASSRALRGLLFEKSGLLRADRSKNMFEEPAHPLLLRTGNQLEEYFAGRRKRFDLPMALDGTPFQKRVWELLLEIPYGETRTYGEIAGRLGDPRKARPVGGAVGMNPVGIIVPCHRVIGGDGSLTGFGGGLEVKSFLLNHETQGGKRPS